MADKKLLEETIIARFQQLANINGGSKAKVLTEGTGNKYAGGHGDRDGSDRASPPFTRNRKVNEAELEEEETVEEAMYDEAEGDESGGDEAAPMELPAGDGMGASMEGGDLEAAVQEVIAGLNKVLAASGMSDKEVELDSGSEEGGEGEEAAPEMDDMGGEPADDMMAEAEEDDKHGAKKMEEELDESIELVDESLIDKLVQRVSARLVAEARKAKALEEGKKKGGTAKWGAPVKHSPAPKKGKGSATKPGVAKPFGTKK